MNILAECRQRDIRIEANGAMLKVDAPKGALSPDLLALLKEHKADLLDLLARRNEPNLDAMLTEACQGVEGIDGATLRALLSPVDVEDIEGGHIPVVTLRAYAESFADGIRCGRIAVLAAAIPKAMLTSRVRCADCRHSERDTIGDGSGIGRCKIGGEGTGPRYPALWANAERDCQDFTTHGAP